MTLLSLMQTHLLTGEPDFVFRVQPRTIDLTVQQRPLTFQVQQRPLTFQVQERP